jgi:hypothetical protein
VSFLAAVHSAPTRCIKCWGHLRPAGVKSLLRYIPPVLCIFLSTSSTISIIGRRLNFVILDMANSSILNDAVLAQICETFKVSPGDIEDAHPCTPLQAGMMVDSAPYMHTLVQSVDLSVDLDRLCRAVDQVIVLNRTLRTRIVYCDGVGLLQVVMRKGPPVLLSMETNVEQFLESDRALNPGLGAGLAEFALVGGVGEKKLVTTTHHALFDYHVVRFFVEDVWSVYQGTPPATRAPFKDFVQMCSGINAKAATAFWKATSKPVPQLFPRFLRNILPYQQRE